MDVDGKAHMEDRSLGNLSTGEWAPGRHGNIPAGNFIHQVCRAFACGRKENRKNARSKVKKSG